MTLPAGDGNVEPRKGRKTMQPFPSLPTAFGNRLAIPTFSTPRLLLSGLENLLINDRR